MDIGKVHITDDDFAKLWSTLFQEFHNLSTTYKCDGILVYNSIYKICTSSSNMEEKLYWKIGDFLHCRCKLHRDRILQTEDYVQEYLVQFRLYSKLVDRIHTLCAFLNNCIKGRQLSDFGYLLWDRIIIQSINKNFFEAVFDYQGDNRLEIIESFQRIKPEISNPQLYYRQKYEKVALNKLKGKYKITNISNLEEFYKGIKTITDFENQSMLNTFLSESYSEVHKTLEECFFSVRYYEILYNLVEYIEFNNNMNSSIGNLNNNNNNNSIGNINITTGNLNDNLHNINISGNLNNINNNLNNFNKNISKYNLIDNTQIHFTESNQLPTEQPKIFFNYKKIPEDQQEQNKINLETENQKILQLVAPLLNKKRSTESEIVEISQICSNFCPLFDQLLDSLNVLNTGYSLLKKAYVIYLNKILKENTKILEASVEEVIQLFKRLNIFKDKDFYLILFSILKDFLQRAKPCYMKRLVDFIVTLANKNTLPEMKPFRINDYNAIPDVFTVENHGLLKIAISLVSDKKEFLVLYQEALCERLLNKSSQINKELSILKILEIEKEDKLYKMIGEMQNCQENFKLLSSVNWCIEPQDQTLPLPIPLLRCIKAVNPEILILDNRYREIELGSSFLMESCNYTGLFICKFKMNYGTPECRAINLTYKYSKVNVLVNSKRCTFNIYQYSLLSLIGSSTGSNLNFLTISSLLGVDKTILTSNLNALIFSGFIKNEEGILKLDCREIKEGNYSNVIQEEASEKHFCVESYLQTVGVKILKKNKTMKLESLIGEMKELSKVEVNRKFIEGVLNKLIEKGIAEMDGESIEFIY